MPFTAITLTLLASTGAAALVAQLISSRPEPTPLMSSSSERIDDIVIRLERIENRLAEINTQPAPASGPQVEPETEEIAGGQDTFGLGQRLARLEQIEQDRQDAAQRRAEERRLQLAQMAAAATDVMLDPLADDQMKAGAWGQIRMNAAETWSYLNRRRGRADRNIVYQSPDARRHLATSSRGQNASVTTTTPALCYGKRS